MKLRTLKPQIATLDTSIGARKPGKGRAGEWSDWYTHSRWRSLRKRFLFANPLCIMCEKEGRLELATVVDHRTPHRGDRVLFWDESNLDALCKRHHDSDAQIRDKGGKPRQAVGEDGWPVP